MEQRLNSAYQMLRTLEPLGDDATEEEKNAFEAMTEKCAVLIGYMDCYIRGVRVASQLEDIEYMEAPDLDIIVPEDTGPTPGQAQRLEHGLQRRALPNAQPSASLEGQAYQRFVKIERAVDDATGCISATEMFEHLIKDVNRKGGYAAWEDEGFVRLLRGYEPAEDSNEMKSIVRSVLPSAEYYEADVLEKCILVEGNEDVMDRLEAREKVIEVEHGGVILHKVSGNVLMTVQAIRYAREWRGISTEAKQKIRQDLFEKTNAEFLDSYPSKRDLAQKKRQFEQRHERVVKARNDVDRLYTEFGAAIFFNSIWVPSAMYEASSTGRSKAFPATLVKVLRRGATVQDKASYEKLLRQFIPCIFSTKGKEYMKAFFKEN